MHSHSDERVLSFGFSGATVCNRHLRFGVVPRPVYVLYQVHTVECMIE